MSRTLQGLSFAFCLAMLGAVTAQASPLLSNPGFESPMPDPQTSVGNWFLFGSAPQGTAAQSVEMPRSGLSHVSLELDGTNQFAGVFQDLPILVLPGQTVIFSGWSRNASGSPFAATQELKLEWSGAPWDQQLSTLLGSSYERFEFVGVAPEGTTGVRVTYAISSFGAGQGDARVFIDDFHAAVVPAPGSLALVGLGLAGLALRRRANRRATPIAAF
jgi:hypothetical protein